MSTSALISFAEFEALPDQPGKRELVDGEVVTMPPPEYARSRIATRIARLLFASVPEDRAWSDKVGYRLAGGWVQPDASVTWPEQPLDGKYLTGAPLLAVEVVAQNRDIERKLALYFQEGVAEVWVIDVFAEGMTVYIRRGDEVLRISVVKKYQSPHVAVTIDLAALFR